MNKLFGCCICAVLFLFGCKTISIEKDFDDNKGLVTQKNFRTKLINCAQIDSIVEVPFGILYPKLRTQMKYLENREIIHRVHDVARKKLENGVYEIIFCNDREGATVLSRYDPNLKKENLRMAKDIAADFLEYRMERDSTAQCIQCRTMRYKIESMKGFR